MEYPADKNKIINFVKSENLIEKVFDIFSERT
jgi:hypothetical protein